MSRGRSFGLPPLMLESAAERERAVATAAAHFAKMDIEDELIEKFEAATPEIQAAIRLILGINGKP